MQKSGKKIQIKQVWIPYWDWEDWINGMWRSVSKEEEKEFLQKAILFTGDNFSYGSAMVRVIKAWPKTMINSLTNPSINKRAFVGHCACCFEFNCPEYITRLAWRELTQLQRDLADMQAENAIQSWRKEYVITLKAGNKDVTLMESRMKCP